MVLVDQSPEQSETEWLRVDVAGYKIVNVYKPPRSRLTPTTIPTFPHPSLYVGRRQLLACQLGLQHPRTVRAWTPGQHPTTLDCCTTERKQPVSSLAVGTSATTQTWPSRVSARTADCRTKSLLSAAKQCIPRDRRKNYVPCWDKECETTFFAPAKEAGYDASNTASHRDLSWSPFSSTSTSLTCQLPSPESTHMLTTM